MTPTEKDMKEDLGDELCKYCPLEKKGVYGVDGGYMAGCEGSRCEDAYENYLESVEDKKPAKEYILCAANYYNDGEIHVHQPNNISVGFITAGRRHHNCIMTFAQIVGFPYSETAHFIHRTEIQGFLTNTNRFVDRKEAYDIAFKADQIIGPNKGYDKNDIGLTSEDLY